MQPDQRKARGRAAVWVVEDAPAYRGDLVEFLDEQSDLHCAASFSSGEAVLSHLRDHFAPDVMLVDIGLGEIDGIQVVERVSRLSPATQLVMLTNSEDNDDIFEAIKSGAHGYLLKTSTPHEVIDAVRVVLEGGTVMTPQIARRVLGFFKQLNTEPADYGLTAREIEVLTLLSDGRSKREIAKELFLSPHTVDTHIRNIYAKLHVTKSTEAVSKALREGLLGHR